MKGRAVARDGWIEQAEAGAWVHARRWPCRMDLAVTAPVSARAGRRLARAIRQDMWRLLRDLRGFSPLVRVSALPDGAMVTAGGQLDAPWPRAATMARLSDLLADPARQARWRNWAGTILLAVMPLGVGAQESTAAVPPSDGASLQIAGAPSGVVYTVQDLRIEPQAAAEPLARVRLIAPDLANVRFATIEANFQWICETLALPWLARAGQTAAQVVVSMAAEPLDLGAIRPDITQYFEIFRPSGDRCIWEVF